MPKTIAEYKTVVGNLSLQHDFDISIPNIPGAGGASTLIKFLARGFDTPDSETMPVEVWWRGRKGEFPGAVRTDGESTLTMNIDDYWLLYKQLYAARQLVGNHLTGSIGDWKTIRFTTVMKMLRGIEPKVTIATFHLMDCYLKNLGTVTKTHDAEAEPDAMDIIIHYDNWWMV